MVVSELCTMERSPVDLPCERGSSLRRARDPDRELDWKLILHKFQQFFVYERIDHALRKMKTLPSMKTQRMQAAAAGSGAIARG